MLRSPDELSAGNYPPHTHSEGSLEITLYRMCRSPLDQRRGFANASLRHRRPDIPRRWFHAVVFVRHPETVQSFRKEELH